MTVSDLIPLDAGPRIIEMRDESFGAALFEGTQHRGSAQAQDGEDRAGQSSAVERRLGSKIGP